MVSQAPSLSLGRVLLTGAAGSLGRQLRPRLRPCCSLLRVSDVAAMDAAQAGEEVVQAKLEDRAAVLRLLEGMNAVVHLGGVSLEKPFDVILQANIVGVYNVYEAARQHGVKRIVFASSNHVTGFYRQDEVVDPAMPVRPDGYYGISKTCRASISTATASRPSACASAPRSPSRRTGACWRHGSAMTT